MHNQVYWPHVAAQVKEHINKCQPWLTFKPKQPKAQLENIVATHPLEFVHLDYLCLRTWGRPGRECFSGDGTTFVQYAQAYVTQSQICPNKGQSPLG